MARVFPAKRYFEYFSFEGKSVATHMNFEKPAFNIHDVCDLLENKDYSQIYSNLEEHEVNATLEYTDWDAYYPAVVVSKEGFSKLINLSPLPSNKKRAIQNWLDQEVMQAVKKNWQENLKPLWQERTTWIGSKEWEHADDDDQIGGNPSEVGADELKPETLSQ
jgi:prophage antirepressor-like protein